MPVLFDFDSRPILAGESRAFTLKSPVPVRIQIRCFVQRPPPPGYRPCRECGALSVEFGQTVFIEASGSIFGSTGGALEIEVADLTGETALITLQVLQRYIDPTSTPNITPTVLGA